MPVPDILKRPSIEEEMLARARAKGLAKAAKAFGGHVRSGQTIQQRNIQATRVGVAVSRAIAKIQAERKAKGAPISRGAAAEELRKRGQAVSAIRAIAQRRGGSSPLMKTLKAIKKAVTYSPFD